MKASCAVSIDLSCVNLGGKTINIGLVGGKIESMTPVNGPANWVALPLPVDPHVHLDKTFTIDRCSVTKPGLFGAIEATQADVENWTAADIRARAHRGLVEAYSNGLSALRTHVDWTQSEMPLAWSVVSELREDWADKMTVQQAVLAPLDLLSDPVVGPNIAQQVAAKGGILGCFIYRNEDLDAKVERVFGLAERYNLSLDFHVDEGLDAQACGFDAVVALTAKYHMSGRVLCGHACSLSIRPKDDVARVIDAAAMAGVALTVLPTTNLHLQDMEQGRSPRLRGLAPMQELRRAGVKVVLGADNVADPFYPRGCYAALAMGLSAPALTVGARGDFMLLEGAHWDDALRDPRAKRHVIRSGQNTSFTKDAV